MTLFKIFLIVFTISIVQCDESTRVATTEIPVELEGEKNNVKIHFMDLNKKEFSEKLAKIEEAFVNQFSVYCNTNPKENCAKGNYSVIFVGHSEKDKYVQDNRYVIASLALASEDPNTNEKVYVKKHVLSDFVLSLRDAIVKESQVDIAFVDDKLVYPARNNLDNFIIIPVSLAFVVALIVFNFVCQRKNEAETAELLMNKFKQTTVPSEEKKLLEDNNKNNSNNKIEVIQMHPRKKDSVEPLNRQSKLSDSFQKDDVKTSDKRKKARTYKTAEAVAGKVTEQIGSSRNMTEENEWMLDSSNRKNEGSNSVELRKKIRKDNSIDDANFGFGNTNNKYQPKYVSGEFNSDGKRKNYEYPDRRVAQRLASYERLPSTYDNVKSTNDSKKSSSVKNIDL